MSAVWARATAAAARLWRDRRGAAVPEFAFLLPVALMGLTGGAQFGALYYLHSTMTTVAEDTSRRVANGQLTAAEGRRHAQDALLDWGVAFAVQVTEPGREVLVDISAPLADAALIDMHGIFDGGTLRARSMAHKN